MYICIYCLASGGIATCIDIKTFKEFNICEQVLYKPYTGVFSVEAVEYIDFRRGTREREIT